MRYENLVSPQLLGGGGMSDSLNKRIRVTVFGGSNPIPGDPNYEDALKLGKFLGASGYAVLTGGYIGTMEAVSKGTAQGGGICYRGNL